MRFTHILSLVTAASALAIQRTPGSSTVERDLSSGFPSTARSYTEAGQASPMYKDTDKIVVVKGDEKISRRYKDTDKIVVMGDEKVARN
ncbi:hypothetical protein G7054_g1850 [Neopestalotiopsis clavispora]|nr:hypothetical protein G7054_g1850 [Neopestalotiopsis clavispora]